MNAVFLLLLAGLSAMAYASDDQPVQPPHHRGFFSNMWSGAKSTAGKIKDKVEDIFEDTWKGIKNVFKG